MTSGWIKLHRKMIFSEVFEDPILLKLFILCLASASHKHTQIVIDGLNNPVALKPGQFVTGRFALHRDFYHKNQSSRRCVNTELSPVTLWRKLKILQKLQILIIKSYTKYSIITVCNWNQYQQNDQQMINKRSTDDQQMITNKKLKNVKETPSLFSLREKYPDQALIDKVFEVLASTRRSGKISDSVLLAQLQKWARYPAERVEAGIRTFLEKDYAGEGKREEYLLGIIRNQKQGEAEAKSTGSALLDQHYGITS